jgi:hypothetical protein
MKPTYKVIKDITGIQTVIRTDADGKEWAIPTDPANSDYQAYLATLVTESAPTA